MATPSIAPDREAQQKEALERLRQAHLAWVEAEQHESVFEAEMKPDTECTVCNRITGKGGLWCPYCGGAVKLVGLIYAPSDLKEQGQ